MAISTKRLFQFCGVALLAGLAAGCGGGGSGGSVNTSGAIDTGFANAGKLLFSVKTGTAANSTIAADVKGNVYLAGISTAYPGDFPIDGAIYPISSYLVKIDDAGKLSNILLGTGNLVYGTSPATTALLPDGSGNLYAAVCAVDGADAGQMQILKLDSNGNPVVGFGSAGKVTLDPCYQARGATTLLRDAGGNLYLVTTSAKPANGLNAIVAYKLDASGAPVANFGSAGRQTFKFTAGNLDLPVASGLDASGNLYIGGTSSEQFNFSNSVYAIAKLDRNGNLVNGFGNGGKLIDTFDPALVPASGLTPRSRASAMAVTAAGNIYLAGSYADGLGNHGMLLAKLDSNGKLVADFGAGGKIKGGFGSNGMQGVNALALDASDNPVIAGYSSKLVGSTNCVSDFAVARLDTEGNLVPSFGNAGQTMIGFGDGIEDYASGLSLDGAGHIYVAGVSNQKANFAAGSSLCSTKGFNPTPSLVAVTRLLQ